MAASWKDHKEKGDFYLKTYQCVQAVDCYNHAIEGVEKGGVRVGLADLYCSRSLCYCRIAESKTGTQRTSLYNLALKDADTAISLDGRCLEGYKRKVSVLLGMNRKADGIVVLTDLLKLYKEKGLNHQSDHSVLSLIRQYKYYSDDRVVKSSPWYKDCRFNKHISVVDPDGTGAFEDLRTPLQTLNEVSLLLRPGRYVVPPGGLKIRSNQDVDIVGDTRDGNETVTIEASDSIDGTSHRVIVTSGGTVKLTNVNILQNCSDETLPGIVVEKGGKCILHSVQGYTKAGIYCKAVNEGTELNIRNCKLKGAVCGVMVTEGSVLKMNETLLTGKVGIEISEGGQVHLQNSTISKCGHQAILSHSGATGAHVVNSKFVSNGHGSDEHLPAVHLSAGHNIIKDCEILKTHGTGVCIDGGCQCIVQNCTFKGNPTAVRVSQMSNCKVLGCRMTELSVGLNALHNSNGSILMKGNTIMGAAMAEVMMSSLDVVPTMEGRLHKVKIADAGKDRRTKHHPTSPLARSPPKFDPKPVYIKQKGHGKKLTK